LNTTVTERSFKTAETRSLFPNSVTLRFAGDAASRNRWFARTLANINPNLTVIDFKSLDYQVRRKLQRRKGSSVALTALFGFLALILASVGLYASLPTPQLAAPAKSACGWP